MKECDLWITKLVVVSVGFLLTSVTMSVPATEQAAVHKRVCVVQTLRRAELATLVATSPSSSFPLS